MTKPVTYGELLAAIPSSRSDYTPSLEELASQIREYQKLCDSGKENHLFAAVEQGRRLRRAKGLCKHGQWTPFLQDKCSFSEQWARTLIRAADAADRLLETETWVSVCAKFESIQHLASAAKSEAPPVPRQPRKARQTPDEEREVYDADVAAAAAKVIDTEVVELREQLAQRDETIRQLTEVKAAMLLELDDLRELLRAILKEADDNGGKLSTCTRMGNAPTTGPLTAEEREFISKVKAEFQARKAAAKPTRKKK